MLMSQLIVYLWFACKLIGFYYCCLDGVLLMYCLLPQGCAINREASMSAANSFLPLVHVFGVLYRTVPVLILRFAAIWAPARAAATTINKTTKKGH